MGVVPLTLSVRSLGLTRDFLGCGSDSTAMRKDLLLIDSSLPALSATGPVEVNGESATVRV
jgi:hypothetical protein